MASSSSSPHSPTPGSFSHPYYHQSRATAGPARPFSPEAVDERPHPQRIDSSATIVAFVEPESYPKNKQKSLAMSASRFQHTSSPFSYSARSSLDGTTAPSSPRPSSPTPSSPSSPTKEKPTLVSPPPDDEKPYHTFSPLRKRMLVYLVSLAALFSPLSSNIYFPALTTISEELHVSQSLIALSVTTYMIVQGIAPSFWGFLADSIGRRPIFIGTFVVYIAANIGLAQVKSFPLLLFWRAVQAAGSSATISIGAGVIGDIASPAERAGFVGTFGGLRMMGQSVGPVLGGLLSQFLGFRSIFYFLLGLSCFTLLMICFLLPETLRDIAGDGSEEVRGWTYTPWYRMLRKSSEPASTEKKEKTKRPKLQWFTIIEPLRFLVEKDVFVTLLFGSVVYAVWSMVTSSTSSTFKDRYGYNDLIIGLCFLPNGIGCVLGSSVTGKMMDADFRKASEAYTASKLESGNKTVKLKKGSLPDDFPVEKSRLCNTWWLSMIFFCAVALYGWSLRLDVVSPLLLQFCIAYSATAVFSINSTLVIDLYPGKSASATAVNNLARCSLGAVGVAFIEKLILALGGTGYAFTVLAGAYLLFTPLIYVELKWGGKWRVERNERLRAKAAGKERAGAA